MSASHDEEYAAVVERERPLVLASAYLLTGDPAQAERVVQLVFAQLYGRWPRVLAVRLEALRAVVNAARAPVDLPWEVRERIELIDGPAPVAAGEALIAGHPARSSDAALTQELTDAIPYAMRESHGSANDLAHGRRLIRRRWI